MAVVDINIIKEWFKNLKKPTQEQFWTWLDSFYHKLDGVPMADVNGLNEALQKKADLVNGMVPESQLPFTINTNEVISIGAITVTANNVHIGVHESGSNKVRINGQILERAFADDLPFTPVIDGNKFLRIVARNQPGLFFLKQSSESDEPQEPALDAGEIHVRLILVTPDGSYIDPEVLNGFVEKDEETWKTITVSESTNFSINITDKRTRFKVRSTNDIPKVLQSIVFSEETNRALEIWIYNDTNLNFSIPNSATNGLSKGFTTAQPPFIILPKTYEKLKYNPETNLVECWKVNASTGLPTISTDSTLEGAGSSVNPLKLSASKNAEIAGKVDKTATPTQGIVSSVAIGQTTADEKLHVNGRVKSNSIVLGANIGTPVPNEIGRKDGFLCYADASGVLRFLSVSKKFIYTPAGSVFSTSQIKIALEASGIQFHDSDVIVNVGSSGYTCSIDNGASDVGSRVFFSKIGTGSVSFTSVRSLNSGIDNVTIMSGNEGSMTKITFGTSSDILTVRNL